jgi:hypothetical protein
VSRAPGFDARRRSRRASVARIVQKSTSDLARATPLLNYLAATDPEPRVRDAVELLTGKTAKP